MHLRQSITGSVTEGIAFGNNPARSNSHRCSPLRREEHPPQLPTKRSLFCRRRGETDLFLRFERNMLGREQKAASGAASYSMQE